MRHEYLPAFETFLVEDVILTLGNLRGTLAWLGRADPGADPGLHRAGLMRLERQVETLEDRARAMCKAIRNDLPPQSPAGTAPYAPAMSLEQLLHDAQGAVISPGYDDTSGVPEFRSRRTARR